MSFWSSEKLKTKAADGKLIEGFDPAAVKHGAYELRLGPEVFLTSYEDGKKRILAEGEQTVIPPGQFGLLLTEEKVTTPSDAIGFISIKAGIKFRGLVNVSGFHVDPGFVGRLKFSVYNAGSRDIVLQRKQRVFLLWFSDFEKATEPYNGEHAHQDQITPDDVMKISGQIASPGQLKKDLENLDHKIDSEIQKLEHKVGVLRWMLGGLFSVGLALFGFSLRGCFQVSTPEAPKQPPSVVAPTTNAGGPQRVGP